MSEALRKLIDKVEAGSLAGEAADQHLAEEAVGEEWINVAHAYTGSLDGAKALHDALLPGWEWRLSMSNARVWLPNGKEGAPVELGMSAVASRAWLLAILRAKLALTDG